MCRVKICLINKKVDIIVEFKAKISTFTVLCIEIMHQISPILNFAESWSNTIKVHARLFSSKIINVQDIIKACWMIKRFENYKRACTLIRYSRVLFKGHKRLHILYGWSLLTQLEPVKKNQSYALCSN